MTNESSWSKLNPAIRIPLFKRSIKKNYRRLLVDISHVLFQSRARFHLRHLGLHFSKTTENARIVSKASNS